MKRANIQIKRAHNQMIKVHYGMKRVQNQIFLRYNRMVKTKSYNIKV